MAHAPDISTYAVTIERDEDGIFVASCPGLPGCHSQGDDLEDALANIRDAIELYLEHAKPNQFQWFVDVRSPF